MSESGRQKVTRVLWTSHTGSWMGTSCGPVMESGVGLRDTACIIDGGSLLSDGESSLASSTVMISPVVVSNAEEIGSGWVCGFTVLVVGAVSWIMSEMEAIESDVEMMMGVGVELVMRILMSRGLFDIIIGVDS